MNYNQGDPAELRDKFWKEMASSNYVMLQLESDAETAAPMTASLDKDANHAIWFFVGRDSRWSEMGRAIATYSAKGHDLFARFTGILVEETDRARLDKQWSNFVEAWFPGGKDDPNLLFLRMELGQASIWAADQGLLTTAKMAMGMDVREDVIGSHTRTAL